jgi:hypothetical protein
MNALVIGISFSPVSNPTVKVVIRSKDDDKMVGRPRYMTKQEASSFIPQWNFHHIDGACYIGIEAE